MPPLARFLVDASSALPGAKRNTVLTTLLLTCEGAKLIVACLQPFRHATARIDEKLVLALYRVCDREGKLALAQTAVFQRLTPPVFRKIFDELYGRSDLTSAEQNAVLWELEGFLFANPRQAPRYERLVAGLLKSPQLTLRVRAASLVGRLNRLDAASLTSFVRGLRSRSPHIRSNTLVGLWRMIERFDRLDPHLRDFLSSAAFRTQVSRMRRSDPEDTTRHNARAVLHALRRVPRA